MSHDGYPHVNGSVTNGLLEFGTYSPDYAWHVLSSSTQLHRRPPIKPSSISSGILTGGDQKWALMLQQIDDENMSF